MLGERVAQPAIASAPSSNVTVAECLKRSATFPSMHRKENGRVGIVNACSWRDGMRRCQRLPELRTPLTRRDRKAKLQGACRLLTLKTRLIWPACSAHEVHGTGRRRPHGRTAGN